MICFAWLVVDGMAKSIRSKWKRKMRAVKRERYGQKELEKLKTIVSKDPLHPSRIIRDVNMADLAAIATGLLTSLVILV